VRTSVNLESPAEPLAELAELRRQLSRDRVDGRDGHPPALETHDFLHHATGCLREDDRAIGLDLLDALGALPCAFYLLRLSRQR
jgi:hypothetical protein